MPRTPNRVSMVPESVELNSRTMDFSSEKSRKLKESTVCLKNSFGIIFTRRHVPKVSRVRSYFNPLRDALIISSIFLAMPPQDLRHGNLSVMDLFILMISESISLHILLRKMMRSD